MPRALVTGPTAGIGAGFARHLAADGYSLVLVARDGQRLEAMASELHGKHGITAEVLVADLSTEEGLSAVERRIADDTAPIDLLINNAGFGQHGMFLSAPIADELRMLRVHVEAILRFTHAALPGMRERGGGQIINVASVAAFLVRGTYGASKAWVVSFSRGVNADVADPRIVVQALCPGFVRTEFHERAGMNTSNISSKMWMTVDSVVQESLRQLTTGKQVVIPGARYRLAVVATKLVPMSLLAKRIAKSGRQYR